MLPVSLKALETVVGREPSVASAATMSLEDFLELDRCLGEAFRVWSPPPREATTFRAFVPFTPGYDDWSWQAALVFAHEVVIPDPIDGVFMDRGGLAFTVGLRAGLEHLQDRQLSDEEVEIERRDLLREAASTAEGLGVLRRQLGAALKFMEDWREPLRRGVVITTPLRTTLGTLTKTAHLTIARHGFPGEGKGLLPAAIGEVPVDGLDRSLVALQEMRDTWPQANVRFASAQQSGSQFLATNVFEWHYVCTQLQLASAMVSDRAAVDMKAILALSAIGADLPAMRGLDAATALSIRSDFDEMSDWQTGLRGVIRRIPLEAMPGTIEFADVASSVLREELAPRIRRLETPLWTRRLKKNATQEAVAVSFSAAGLAGLTTFLSVSPVAFATLPLYALVRLAVSAIFNEPVSGESTVLVRLVRRKP